MIDLRLLREQPDLVRASATARGEDPSLVDALLAADTTRREALLAFETLRAEQKAAGKNVAAAKGVPVSALTGSTPEEWEAAADALLEWRAAQQVQDKPAKPVRGLKSGATSSDQILDAKERAAAAIRAMRSQI